VAGIGPCTLGGRPWRQFTRNALTSVDESGFGNYVRVEIVSFELCASIAPHNSIQFSKKV
jgi:hypothetical protein